MNIFDQLTEVNSAVKFYKRLALVSVILMFSGFCFGFVYFIHISSKVRSEMWALEPDGTVRKGILTSVEENRPIEAEAHCKMFTNLFFQIDKFTYKDRLNQAFDLGNSCIYDLYNKLEKDRWFENIVQYNVVQTVTGLKAKCTRDTAPYTVSVEFDLRLDSDASDVKNYMISIACEVQEGQTARTPQNPHSLTISKITVRKFTQI
jgi:hypothetical protein